MRRYLRVLVYCFAAFVAVATGVLWLHASEEEGRIEDVAITLAQDSEGGVIATVHNRSRGRLQFSTNSHVLQVLEAGVWRSPPPITLPCGVRDPSGNHWVAAGGTFRFRVIEGLAAVQPGQRIRVAVGAFTGYKTGGAVSDTLVFSRPKNHLPPMSAPLSTAHQPPATPPVTR